MAEELAQYKDQVDTFFKTAKFEAAHCIFCPPEIQRTKFLFKKDTMNVVQCHCGFVFNETQPTQESLKDFYKNSTAMNLWSEIKSSDFEDDRQKEKFGYAVKYLEALKPKSVLDLGCGTGKFLTLLSHYLKKAVLVGVDTHAGSLEHSEGNLSFINLDIMTYLKYLTEPFEVVTLWGVLEHVKDPIGLLKQIRERLTGPSLIFVCVPNFGSEVVEELGPQCFTFCPQHLWYFTHATLYRAFKESGFEFIEARTIEPEAKPVIRARMGHPPYEPLNSWGEITFCGPEHVKFTSEEILNSKKGYKIIAVASAK